MAALLSLLEVLSFVNTGGGKRAGLLVTKSNRDREEDKYALQPVFGFCCESTSIVM